MLPLALMWEDYACLLSLFSLPSFPMTLWILIALVINLVATGYGWLGLLRGFPTRMAALILGITSSVAISLALGVRGEMRGACPLMDAGEVALFIAWSLSLFYILTGGNYRVSLLGLFTAPVITLLLLLVLVPGMLTPDPVKLTELDPWKESHAATSVLSFGSLGMGGLASLMFLLLNKGLKQGRPNWFTMRMPPVNTLIRSVRNLLTLGVVILTVGIICGFVTSVESGLLHLIAAGGVWVAYCVLIGWHHWRGLPPRMLARWALGLFLFSCILFTLI